MVSLPRRAAMIAASFIKFCRDAPEKPIVRAAISPRSTYSERVQGHFWGKESFPQQGPNTRLLGQRLVAAVDAQDGDAALLVREVDGDAAVEAARAQEGRIEDVSAVRRGEDDDA
jgi:hypothetical protein